MPACRTAVSGHNVVHLGLIHSSIDPEFSSPICEGLHMIGLDFHLMQQEDWTNGRRRQRRGHRAPLDQLDDGRLRRIRGTVADDVLHGPAM